MARARLSEYRAKTMLLGGAYKGIRVVAGENPPIPPGEWVVKVDQGIKKRMKQGLVVIGASPSEARAAIQTWQKKGFSQFLLEPLVPHHTADEEYFSLERVREGIRVLHAPEGGIDIEAYPEKVRSYLLASEHDATAIAAQCGIPQSFLAACADLFAKAHVAFLEINPLIVRDGLAIPLDAAVLVDDTAAFFARGTWGAEDIVRRKGRHPAEERIEELAATTPAALKLKVVNPDGALFFLLSGGGGSIVIADEVAAHRAGKIMANYGEYSGGPTREETYLYAKEIIALLLASRTKTKALCIAGGIANFTDIQQTFAGIIDALAEAASQLRAKGVRVFVRRGGPNEAAGLAAMREFLERENLLGIVCGSDAPITAAVEEALAFIQK